MFGRAQWENFSDGFGQSMAGGGMEGWRTFGRIHYDPDHVSLKDAIRQSLIADAEAQVEAILTGVKIVSSTPSVSLSALTQGGRSGSYSSYTERSRDPLASFVRAVERAKGYSRISRVGDGVLKDPLVEAVETASPLVLGIGLGPAVAGGKVLVQAAPAAVAAFKARVITTALNPVVIQNAMDFSQAVVVPGPPAPAIWGGLGLWAAEAYHYGGRD